MYYYDPIIRNTGGIGKPREKLMGYTVNKIANRKNRRAPNGGGRFLESRARRFGFSLIEVLVTVAVIAVLLAILLPALQGARDQSRGAVCLSNLRQIGLAAYYYAERDRWYPRAYWSAEKRWMDAIKPFLTKNSEVYRCPMDSKQIAVTWDPTIIMSYGINTFRFADPEFCFWYGVRMDRIKRPQGVIIFADCTPGKYYCGGGNQYYEPIPDVDYRHHDRRFNVVFCDGHAEARKTSRRLEWDASQ